MESSEKSDVVMLVQSYLVFMFFSLVVTFCYLHFSMVMVLEFLKETKMMEMDLGNDKRKKKNEEKSVVRRTQKSKKGRRMRKRYRVDKKSYGNRKQKETKALTTIPSQPRPSILNGTSITTKIYISVLYNMLQVVNLNMKKNANENVKLCDPRVPLTKIMKYLNVRQFMRTASTCRFLREKCLNLNLKIKQSMDLKVRSTCGSPRFEPTILSMNSYKHVTLYREHLKNIRHLPFLFSISLKLEGHLITEEFWNKVSGYINGFKNFKVISLKSNITGAIDWPRTTEFIQKHSVDKVKFKEMITTEGMLHLMPLSLKEVTFHGRPTIEMFFNVPIGSLTVKQSFYTLHDITSIIQFWIDGELTIDGYWDLSCERIWEELDEHMRTWFTELDDDYEGPLPATRPLIVHTDGENITIFTKEDRILSLRYEEDNDQNFSLGIYDCTRFGLRSFLMNYTITE